MHLFPPSRYFDGVMSILATKHSCQPAWYYENSYVSFLRIKYYFIIIEFDSFLLMLNHWEEAVLDIGSNSYACLEATTPEAADHVTETSCTLRGSGCRQLCFG